jgi:hypothetical protein
MAKEYELRLCLQDGTTLVSERKYSEEELDEAGIIIAVIDDNARWFTYSGRHGPHVLLFREVKALRINVTLEPGPATA